MQALTSSYASVGAATCLHCSSMVVPGLAAGSSYVFAVSATNSAGTSPTATESKFVTVNRGCATSQYCITADATTTSATIGHAAAGLLHSGYAVNRAATAPLGLTGWRVAITPTATGLNYAEYDSARAAGAPTITAMLSDAWFYVSNGGCAALSDRCGATPPWQELSTYSQWVTAYVKQVEASGRYPTYWDIQNEPDGDENPGQYFTTAGAATVTPANEMAVFAAAYAAIKAADPNAKVEGPSLADFRTTADPVRLDMNTFLSYSAAHGLRWDAISWHENDAYLDPADWNSLPTVKIGEDVAMMNTLLAEYPSIGHPVIAINEFGRQDSNLVPGWFAAYLDSLESAGVATANRACFRTATNTAPDPCDLAPSTLDDLLTASGAPGSDYEVLAAYAGLAGRRIATTPSDVTLSALGSIDTTSTVRLLIGRAFTCTAAVNPDCDEPASWTPAPTNVVLTVKVPWTGAATVTINRIPDLPGRTASTPLKVSSATVTVTRGAVSFTLPQVGDGEAWTVTISPSGSAPVAPATARRSTGWICGNCPTHG